MVKLVNEPKAINVEEYSELARIVENVCKTNEPVVLRRNGRDVAIIEPIDAVAHHQADQPPRIVEREALRRSAGGWEGLVNVEEFREHNMESRRLSSRPPVSL